MSLSCWQKRCEADSEKSPPAVKPGERPVSLQEMKSALPMWLVWLINAEYS